MKLPKLLTKKYRKTTSSDGLQVIDLHPLMKECLEREFCHTRTEYFGEFVNGVRHQSKTTYHIDLKGVKKTLSKDGIKVDGIEIDPRKFDSPIYIKS